MNGYQQEGVGRMDMTIRQGRRWSAARAYLLPAMDRPNLHVVTRALTTRVLLERGRAVGVEYVEGGIPKSVRAAREVILAGGAINSPQLLMLSGIGPADHLREVGVPVAHDLPGVGRDLQDHLELYIQYESRQPVTLLTAMRPHNMVRIGVRWFLSHDGLAASSHLEAGGFIRSAAGVRHPDIQYHFLPALVSDHGRAKGGLHAFQAHVGPMRPASRGWLHLRSAGPQGPPGHRAQLPERGARPGGAAGLRPAHARDLRSRGLHALPRPRADARAGGGQRRGDRRLRPPQGGQRLPPLLHLPDGDGRAGGGRPGLPGAGARGLAGGRRVGDAEHGRAAT